MARPELDISQVRTGQYGHGGGVVEIDHSMRVHLSGVGDHDWDPEGARLTEVAIIGVTLDHDHPLVLGHQSTHDTDADRTEADDNDVVHHAGHLATSERALEATRHQDVGQQRERGRDQRPPRARSR